MDQVDINKGGVYLIRNKVNGLIYIGIAIHFRKRWNLHKANLNKRNHHSRHLQHAWNKYGPDAFEFKIIEMVEDKTKLLEREQFWLDWLKPYDPIKGYNICKVAESRLGIKSSPEHIAKIVAANKGKKKTFEQKEFLRQLRLGTKLTEEQKTARRNYRHAEEDKIKISLAGKGRKHTKEAKAEMSLALKGKKQKSRSIETKLKISLAVTKIWADRKQTEVSTNG